MLSTVLADDENSLGEDVATMTTQYQVLDRPEMTLTQESREVNIARQYPHEGVQMVRGIMGGELTLRFPWTGHGGTTVGALSETDLNALMGWFFGNSDADSVGTEADGTGTAAAFGVDGGTFEAGSMFRLGARGDGAGEGKWGVTDSLAGGTLTTLTAFSGAPADGDVVYAAQHVYPVELPASLGSIAGKRFRVMTANGQFLAHGCTPMSASFSSLNVGEFPEVSLTMDVAWWEPVNETFPDTTGTDAKAWGAVAGGQVFYQAVGTDTHQTVELPRWSLEIEMINYIARGHAGFNDFQSKVDCKRGTTQARVTMTHFKAAAGTDTWLDIFNTAEASRTGYHWIVGLGTVDGQALAFRFNNLILVGPPPTQVDLDGLNAVDVTWRADVGPDKTTDITAASWLAASA